MRDLFQFYIKLIVFSGNYLKYNLQKNVAIEW